MTIKKLTPYDLQKLLYKIPKEKRADFSRDYLALIKKYVGDFN